MKPSTPAKVARRLMIRRAKTFTLRPATMLSRSGNTWSSSPGLYGIGTCNAQTRLGGAFSFAKV